MKIVDRYLIREFISPFFLAVFVFALILLTDVIIRSIEIFITNKVNLWLILRFLMTSLPFILQMTIPMAVLTGTLIAFGRLSGDSELTALRANGISLYRMAFPILFCSLFAWGVCQYITVVLISKTGVYRQQIAFEIMESNVNIGIKPHVFNDLFPDLVIYCDNLQPRTGLMEDIFIFRQQESSVNYIFARSGVKDTFPKVKQIVFSLTDGVIHETEDEREGTFSCTRFNRNDIAIDIPSQQDSEVSLSDEELDFAFLHSEMTKHRLAIKKFNEQNISFAAEIKNLRVSRKRELKNTNDTAPKPDLKAVQQEIKKKQGKIRKNLAELETLNRRYIKFQLVMNKKFAFPLACIIFPLIGIPLGIRSRAGGKSTGFSLSIALILIYYILLIGGEGFSRDGTIEPWLGIWTANILMTVVGIYLFFKVATERPFKVLAWFGWKISSFSGALWRLVRKSRTDAQKASERQRRTYSFNHSFPRILDLYISREFLRVFVLLCFVIVSITVIVEFISSIRFLLQYDAAFSDFVTYILLRIPFFLVLSIHVAVLIATILSINGLARNHELTAMKAGGISLIRASSPMFIIAFAIACIVLVFNERVVPRTNNLGQEIFQYKIKKKSRPSLFTNNKNWYRGSENSIYSFSSFDQRSGDNVLNDFLLYGLDSRFLPSRRITARQVIWNHDEECWYYKQGEETTYDKDGMPVDKRAFDMCKSYLTEDVSEFQQGIKDSDKMNYRELRAYVNSLRAKGIDTTMYRTDLMAKLSMPFISWVIALFGIPFAITFARSGTLVGIGFSIFIGMIYFVTYRIGISLGHSGQLPPLLAAWGANLLFTFIGLYLIFRART